MKLTFEQAKELYLKGIFKEEIEKEYPEINYPVFFSYNYNENRHYTHSTNVDLAIHKIDGDYAPSKTQAKHLKLLQILMYYVDIANGCKFEDLKIDKDIYKIVSQKGEIKVQAMRQIDNWLCFKSSVIAEKFILEHKNLIKEYFETCKVRRW